MVHHHVPLLSLLTNMFKQGLLRQSNEAAPCEIQLRSASTHFIRDVSISSDAQNAQREVSTMAVGFKTSQNNGFYDVFATQIGEFADW